MVLLQLVLPPTYQARFPYKLLMNCPLIVNIDVRGIHSNLLQLWKGGGIQIYSEKP